MIRPTCWAMLALALAPSPPDDPAAFDRETRTFQAKREANLRAEDGWLAVSGLAWLKPGESRVGSAPGAAVGLPARAPGLVGTLALAGDAVDAPAEFRPAPGVAVLCNGQPFAGGPIRSDANGAKADILSVGEFRLILLRRNDRFAVRVKDNAAATRTRFGGCRWYDPDPSWRVAANFLPHPSPKSIRFETIVGGEDIMPSAGLLTFERDGQSHTLEAVAEADGKLWVVFRDATAGITTAGNARQLTVDPPVAGLATLDFNRAINLPCAYIDHATCPIPPERNRLPIPIPAGEKLPAPPRPE